MVRESREITSSLVWGTARRDIKTWTFLGLPAFLGPFTAFCLCPAVWPSSLPFHDAVLAPWMNFLPVSGLTCCHPSFLLRLKFTCQDPWQPWCGCVEEHPWWDSVGLHWRAGSVLPTQPASPPQLGWWLSMWGRGIHGDLTELPAVSHAKIIEGSS